MNDEANGQTASTEATPATPATTAKPRKAAKPKAKPAKKAKAKGKTPKGVKGPAVLRQYAPGYHKDKERKTAGGHVSVDCNDPTASKLRGKDLDFVYREAARVLKEPESALRSRYKGLNVGMQRMNLGNRIRAALA